MFKKVSAFLLALLVALGIGWSSNPAEAAANNRVINKSIGWVHVLRDNASTVWLAGYNATGRGISAVIVEQGSCVQVSNLLHCAPYSRFYVYVAYGTFYVKRIS